MRILCQLCVALGTLLVSKFTLSFVLRNFESVHLLCASLVRALEKSQVTVCIDMLLNLVEM